MTVPTPSRLSGVRRHARRPLRRHSRGFSLIELMVSLVIALALIVAMGIVSTRYESTKRQVGASADLSLNTAYLTYDLDRQIRSAGSGFANNSATTYGCELYASKGNAQILPASKAFPEPFETVPTSVRMMPILVHAGAGAGGSDVIQLMTGAAGGSENATEVRLNSVATNTLRLTNTVGMKGDDLLLLSEPSVPCMLQQVQTGFSGGAAGDVPLAGTYYASSVGTHSINTYSKAMPANALVLGNIKVNPPRLQLIGVSSDQHLVAYDLLRFNNNADGTPLLLAEGVVDLRVRYGVAASAATPGVLTGWVMPNASPYDVATLNSGSLDAQAAIANIVAVKIAVVLRSDRVEKDAVMPATLTLFPGMDTALQSTYTVADTKRKHRVVEFTVPLRNPILASGRPAPP